MVAESVDRPDSLPEKVVAGLDRIARGQRTRRQAIASAHGITPLQAELLVTLSYGEPPAPLVGLLARELGVSQPTVTDSLRALERKSLITRLGDPGDARRVIVALTPAGSELVTALGAVDSELVDTVASLPHADQEALLGHVLALIAGLVERGSLSVARTCLTCRFHERTGEGGHRCALLDTALAPGDLRVNCPDHEPRAAAV